MTTADLVRATITKWCIACNGRGTVRPVMHGHEFCYGGRCRVSSPCDGFGRSPVLTRCPRCNGTGLEVFVGR